MSSEPPTARQRRLSRLQAGTLKVRLVMGVGQNSKPSVPMSTELKVGQTSSNKKSDVTKKAAMGILFPKTPLGQ